MKHLISKITKKASQLGIYILGLGLCMAQSSNISVESFTKVSIHPHIQVDFIQGDQESVSIESISVPEEKLTVKVEDNTLHLYLEGARIFTKKEKKDWDKHRKPIYKGTIVKAIITYKNINNLSLKGEESFAFKNFFKSDELKATIYGASKIHFDEVKLEDFKMVIYGEAQLSIEKGSIQNQYLTTYGEADIKLENILNKTSKVTAYGDANFQLNVSDYLKVSSFGEAKVLYKGSPEIKKGMVFGKTQIEHME